MLLRRSAWWLPLWLALPAVASATALTLCYEDVAQRPWSTPAAVGLNFDLLRQVEKQLGESFIYTAKPWRRCLEEVRLGTVDGVIGAVDSLERRSAAVFPTLADGRSDPARALYDDNVNIFLRNGGKASWDGSKLDTPQGVVAVQSGYLIASQLRQQGLQPKELVKSAEDGLRLLTTGLYDAAVLQGLEAEQLVRHDARFQGKVLLATPPYAQRQFHLVFSHARYQREPQRIEAVWRAIASVRQSADYQQRLNEARALH
ncbi:MAG: substrate-binding periplasmic protein [Sphingomonadaceae bacterium]